MEPVKISDLKNRLSHYLGQVRRGQSILVADRDQVIARIDPAGGVCAVTDDRTLNELERRGTIRRARAKLSDDWLQQRPQVDIDVVTLLVAERDEGR